MAAWSPVGDLCLIVHAGRIMVLSIVLVFIPGIKHGEPIMDG
jgi:hypothetical protein